MSAHNDFPEIRCALITGASSGIGASLARRLASPGRRLAIIGRSPERLAAVAAECTAAGATVIVGALDVTDRAALATFMTEVEGGGQIDLLVSNAGILDGRRTGEALESIEAARKVLNTNLMAAVEAIHMALPGMRARDATAGRRGAIVLVASLAALSPLADAPAYSAAKAGLLFYGLGLREALAAEGIRVIVSCPGYVATAMASQHQGYRPHEISADRAAGHILSALKKNHPISGFPFLLYWSARFSLIVPEFVRRAATRALRFYVS